MNQNYFKFEIIHQSKKSRARVGKIYTPHGVIDTPNFVAVGTNATLKALDPVTTDNLGLQLMFCNTYHLMIQPGSKVVKQAGGLHKFINRNYPIITDSGGFQVFSLKYGGVANELKSRGLKKQDGSVLKINEEGVLFRSYKDGEKILLSPETSIAAQKDLGADIIIPFDELPPYHINDQELKTSFERTHRWQKRSLNFHLNNPKEQAMYAVIHGGINLNLRKNSCQKLSELPFNGFAIGGSLGKNTAELLEVVNFTTQQLPTEFPNHLLGIGDLPTIDNCIPFGVDTFDSSYPTRAARHGILFTSNGPLKISPQKYATDFSKPDPKCHCPTCSNYSRAYLNHLIKAHEPSYYQLASIHNIAYMVKLMQNYRELILQDLV